MLPEFQPFGPALPTLTELRDAVVGRLGRVLARVWGATAATTMQQATTELKAMSATLDDQFIRLRNEVATQGSVIGSATVAFSGLVAQLAGAEAEAKSAGVTEEQIAGVVAVRRSLQAHTAALAAAIPANTAMLG